ncbi:very-long-chain 3-oxoacyl-CoA reductase-like isoform X2 [Eublepharis macularius]|uniref:Very-long-chain 3-oxoacyl-CoA reductase-like isoform X2 n=1 Tax=Eublepharis macularius TaxID=481883 RepID=A0AA97LKS4_EUBMA|nr:very-long-chain 3-oxoacyl-CoA reductase-like isoform X2 [Eublepharis macularius]
MTRKACFLVPFISQGHAALFLDAYGGRVHLSCARLVELPERSHHCFIARETGEEMAIDSSALPLDHALNVLGVLTFLWLFVKIALVVGWVMRVYVLSEKWRGVDLASYGPWAVVTGSTSGIGKAYAHELARRGFDVVLISRSMEKLKQVAAEIEQQHGRSTKVIQTDFTGGSEIYEPIRAALQGLEIGVLVNNVGMVANQLVPFLSVTNVDKYTNDAVNCNMLSTVKMTQIILPQMVARKKGIIINFASFGGARPWPFNLMYGATKTFVDFFSQGLDIEYGSKGIIVQSVLPLYVATGMTAVIDKRFTVSSESFVRQALNTVGLSDRVTGCLSHAVQKLAIELVFPVWLHLFVAGTTLFEKYVGKVF